MPIFNVVTDLYINRMATEQGEHLNYSHQRHYLSCTSHGGGRVPTSTNYELLFFDFRKLLPYLTDDGKTHLQQLIATEKELQRDRSDINLCRARVSMKSK